MRWAEVYALLLAIIACLMVVSWVMLNWATL